MLEMNTYIALALLLAFVLVVAALAVLRRRGHLHAYGEAWRRYNAGAFRETVEPSPDERFSIVTRLADELSTRNGQCAVSMRGDGGWAIQHINKTGTFSQRGPYYISQYRGTWRPTGRRLLIKNLRGRKGFGFRPDHYNQSSGLIWEKGLNVLEYGTDRYAPVTLGDFVAMQRVKRSG